MFCYFLVASIFTFMYRPIHYSNLVKKRNTQTEWHQTFGDTSSFEDGWGEDR